MILCRAVYGEIMSFPKKTDVSIPHEQPSGGVHTQLSELSPAYFGMAMATGIVSLGTQLVGLNSIANALFLLNIIAYTTLLILTVLRMSLYPRRFFGDMTDHLRGSGFFTTIAATGILGSQFILLKSNYFVGAIFLVVAVLLWVGLTYTIFASFTIKEEKPTLDKGISGAWLLIAILSALLAEHVGQPGKLEMNFLALSMWLWGGMLYIWMMSLIFYRYTFFPFSPADLSPPYWINMGAMAISTLAGSLLIINVPHAPYLASLLPFIKGFTVFYWVTGTWWIPMLLILGIWRHVYKRFPLKYDPLYWGAVFPLGMYAVSTGRMSQAMGFDFLWFLAPVFLCIALLAWTMTFSGLVKDFLRRARAFRV